MERLRKCIIFFRLGIFIIVILCGGQRVSAAASELKARPQDLIDTRIRNVTVNLFMDLIPQPMVDPAIDDGATFSYFLRPSFQLGLRGEPYATQVIDGHLWTGAAEWLMLAGVPLEPVSGRIWTLEKGFLPCISYRIDRGGVIYTLTAFQFWRDDSQKEPLNFVRVTAANEGTEPVQASFAGAFMYGPRDHRSQQMRQMTFNPGWRYEMTELAALRQGQIIYVWSKTPARRLAREKREYRRPFAVASRTEPVALSVYEKELAPGETLSADFVVPHYPAGAEEEAALAALSFDERHDAFVRYWEGWLAGRARFEVAEEKVVNASRSYVIHALMCQNVISPDEVEQHVNRFQYNRFWLRDSSFFVSMYERFGYPEIGRALCRHFFQYQREDGNFLSQRGQLDGWGQSLWAFGTHVRYTGDQKFAVEAVPYIERAVAWLRKALAEDAWGLMPPTDAFDNEMIQGRYTGHNFWALTGLEAAIDLCRAVGREDLAQEYEALRREYSERFITRLREVAAANNGVIPPGLDVPGGTDWGNLLPVYPGFILDPFDPLVTATFNYIRTERMQEGIMLWQKSLHHYLTERVAQTALVRGEQELALDDFYAMLLHTGACHEGFEWTIFPWNGRDYCHSQFGVQTCNFPPHGWYAANFNLLFRNLLLREQGRELHLCSAISPEWAKPGDWIVVENAPFWLAQPSGPRPGKISYTIKFTENTSLLEVSQLEIKGGETAEGEMIFHLPYFLAVKSASWENKALPLTGPSLRLPLRPGPLQLTFERLPAAPKSYARAVEWYKEEYRRRWEERKR